MVLCENCKNKVANVEVTEIINNQKRHMHLCEECAREKEGLSINFPSGINDFLSQILNSMCDLVQTEDIKTTKEHIINNKCNVCNMTYSDFVNTGMLGCPNCYESFSNKLGPIFERLHGNKKHIGKVPKNIEEKLENNSQIEKFKNDLQKAITDENYEEAAILRDKIKDLEKKKD